MGCTLAKFARFSREISSFLPLSGNLWGARAPCARTPPLRRPCLKRCNLLSGFASDIKMKTPKICITRIKEQIVQEKLDYALALKLSQEDNFENDPPVEDSNSGKELHKCDFCGKSFGLERFLKLHISKSHKSAKSRPVQALKNNDPYAKALMKRMKSIET